MAQIRPILTPEHIKCSTNRSIPAGAGIEIRAHRNAGNQSSNFALTPSSVVTSFKAGRNASIDNARWSFCTALPTF